MLYLSKYWLWSSVVFKRSVEVWWDKTEVSMLGGCVGLQWNKDENFQAQRIFEIGTSQSGN